MDPLKIKAPEFSGIKAWINSRPLTIQGLAGKAILIDFWTYTCINCIRTLPFLKKMQEKYPGLVVIGVHTPEFTFEEEEANVRKAVKDLGITFPVAVDSERQTWNEYANNFWPSKYVADKEGYVIFVHAGEGGYSAIEHAIQEALGVKGKTVKDEHPTFMFDQSPETYLGLLRNPGMGSGLACDESGCFVYVDAGGHERDKAYPNGQWEQETEFLELLKAPGQLSYKFNARQVNLVMGPSGEKPANARVFIDGKESMSVKVDAYRMYTLFTDKKFGEHELAVLFDAPVRVYAFTFG